MSQFLWICLDGAAGTGARFLLTGWSARTLGEGFSYGTLAVNVIGSFLLGGLMHVGLTTSSMSPTLRLALTTGVMGGFTTYSTFSYETLAAFESGAWKTGCANVLVTVLGCLAACALGALAAKWMLASSAS